MYPSTMCDVIKVCVLALMTSFVQWTSAHYARRLSLDFLCSRTENDAYVTDMPWDCASYVICMNGQAIPTACPQGKLYAAAQRNSKCEPAGQVDATRCVGQIWKYIQAICQNNPQAAVPDASKCGQYYHCAVQDNALEYMDYLLECPYPTLFSTQTGACEDYRFVACGEREEPKAPCDYLQYLQLYNCTGSNCVSCKRHHPSCVGLMNGRQPVPLRNDVLMECDSGRTLSIIHPTEAKSQMMGGTHSTSVSVSGRG